jgi:hypothetical protein
MAEGTEDCDAPVTIPEDALAAAVGPTDPAPAPKIPAYSWDPNSARATEHRNGIANGTIVP